MTSMITGLPDRYRPLDEVGPEETTSTGIIRCWRAKDRVLNRDVAIRVHSPGGAAARGWIARALTAGGLATPTLAMVYDAAEGSDLPGQESVAYVVNEWIEGETLAERLSRGPLPERDTRTLLRRLAEGVAEAHRAGLAVGGLTPQRVVLRPNGLVGVRAVPAASGSVAGDIAALGALLETCLTGRLDGGGRIAQPDLAALVRRARSTEPGQGLSSAAAMATLLADRSRGRAGVEPMRTGSARSSSARGDSTGSEPVPSAAEPLTEDQPDDRESSSGWLRRLRERRSDGSDPPGTRILDPGGAPAEGDVSPAGATRAIPAAEFPPVVPPPAAPPANFVVSPPYGRSPVDDDADDEQIKDEVFGAPELDHADLEAAGLLDDDRFGDRFDDRFGDDLVEEPVTDEDDAADHTGSRRKLLTIGVPILALALVMGFAWWLGNNVLSVAGSMDSGRSTLPSVSAGAAPPSPEASAGPRTGAPVQVRTARIFDPFGDGEPENDSQVPLSYDGNPETAWPTLQYGTAALGNLKPGVGVLYDLGSPQALSGVTLTTTLPGPTLEIRTGDQARGSLDSYRVVGSATLERTTEIQFDEPVTNRFVLVWITELTASGDRFEADVAELVVHSAR